MPQHVRSCEAWPNEHKAAASLLKKRRKPEATVLESFMSDGSKQERDKALLKAIIISTDSSIAICEDEYFRRFVKSLVTSYRVRSRYKLQSSIWSRVHEEALTNHVENVEKAIGQQNFFTLVVDGWSSVGRKSLFGVLLARPDHVFYTIGHI